MLEPLEGRTMMSTTYYVSPSGSDSNSGTSSSKPFKDISKINSIHLNAGDTVLFQGGQTFYGNIRPESGGNSSTAVTFGSYGSGKATINGGTSYGFYDYNMSGFLIENLNFVGTVSNGNENQDGIKLEAASNQSNVSVENCSISGFYYAGIRLQGDGNSGFTNVNFTEDNVSNNQCNGILTTSQYGGTVHHNVYIAYDTANDMNGNKTEGNCGSGMSLQGLNNATIQYNVADYNGDDTNGGCGIEMYDSTGITLQYNVAVDNHSATSTDGDGFDMDSETSNSIAQYNYAAGNYGNGFMLNAYSGQASNNDVIRYNISQDNGMHNNYADLEAYGDVTNSAIYNNVAYVVNASNGGTPSGIKVHNSALPGVYVSNLTIANNIVITSGSNVLAVNIPQAESQGASNLKLRANDYWAASGSLKITYGNSTYSSVSSFESGTGQEKISGSGVGLQVNPDLSNAGNGPALSSASGLGSALSAYKISSSSPVIGKGVNITSYGFSNPSTDFFGDGTSTTANDVGADQVAGSKTATPAVAIGPSGWTSADIGSTGATGSSSYSGGTYNISGSGANIMGNSDAFHYTYTTLSGNGQIVAEVDSISAADQWAKAGIMLRDGTGSNAKEVSMVLSPNGYAQFQSRSSVGGSTTQAQKTGVSSKDEYVKLVRSGNTVTGYISSNDSTWTEIGSSTVSLDTTLQVGLAVDSHDTGEMASAVFSNVSVS